MLITNKNYGNYKKDISDFLKQADLISMDLEFTGLYKTNYGEDRCPDFFSSIQDYYDALSQSVKYYYPIQVGFSIYQTVESKKVFKTFYFHPSNKNNITFDPASLLFLAEHQYDFKQTFTETLNFNSPERFYSLLSPQVKDQVKDKTDDPYPNLKFLNSLEYFYEIPEDCDDIRFIDQKVKSFIEPFLQTDNKDLESREVSFTFHLNLKDSVIENKDSKENEKITEEEKLQKLGRLSKKIKNHLYEILKIHLERFEQKLKEKNLKYELSIKSTEEERPKDRVNFQILLGSKDKIKTHQFLKRLKKLQKNNYCTEIIQKLLFSGKPIILHSGGFDFLLLIQHFLFDLPTSYTDFLKTFYFYRSCFLNKGTQRCSEEETKILINIEGYPFVGTYSEKEEEKNRFKIYDTKVLLNSKYSQILKDELCIQNWGNLATSYNRFKNFFESKSSNSMKTVKFTRYQDELNADSEHILKAHHAGYDAEMTAQLFIYICSILKIYFYDIEEENQIFLYNSYTRFYLYKEPIKVKENIEEDNKFCIELKNENKIKSVGDLIDAEIKGLDIKIFKVCFKKGRVIVWISKHGNGKNKKEALELISKLKKSLDTEKFDDMTETDENR